MICWLECLAGQIIHTLLVAHVDNYGVIEEPCSKTITIFRTLSNLHNSLHRKSCMTSKQLLGIHTGAEVYTSHSTGGILEASPSQSCKVFFLNEIKILSGFSELNRYFVRIFCTKMNPVIVGNISY